MTDDALVETILDFWVGPMPHRERVEWFRKDPAFDATIRERFGDAVEAALAGGHRDWIKEARPALARVLLLDQFTRNIYRDSARAYAGDADALATAIAAVDARFDAELDDYERWFMYMPFVHSEELRMQERSLALFQRLADEGGPSSPLQWAHKHAAVIRRFGRYPHRNALLGRESTAEESAFLQEQGSRF